MKLICLSTGNNVTYKAKTDVKMNDNKHAKILSILNTGRQFSSILALSYRYVVSFNSSRHELLVFMPHGKTRSSQENTAMCSFNLKCVSDYVNCSVLVQVGFGLKKKSTHPIIGSKSDGVTHGKEEAGVPVNDHEDVKYEFAYSKCIGKVGSRFGPVKEFEHPWKPQQPVHSYDDGTWHS